MKIKITIIFLLISILSIGQEKDSTKLKDIELVEILTYSITSGVFNSQKLKSKIDTDYKLPWIENIYKDLQIKQALDTLIYNATIKIEKSSFSGYNLIFNSYFPEFMDKGLIDIFKLSIKNSNITNEGKELVIQESGSSGFGSYISAGYKDGNTYSNNWRTLNTTFNIKTTITTDKYKGAVQFESGFVNGYDYIKITNLDISKHMKIGNYEFTVVDIINNSVILDFNTDIENLDFKLVNLNEKGQRLFSSEGYFSAQTVYKDIYLKFKENPNLSFENYKKAFHSRYMEIFKNAENKKETPKYIFGKGYRVFSLSEKLVNAYLYLPKYISKTFEITYNENMKERVPSLPLLEKKLQLNFESEEGVAVLLGDNIELLDKDLNLIKNIESGTFIKTLEKTLTFYKEKKEDDTCQGYKYIKIEHQGKEYLVAGKNVVKFEKLNNQPKQNNNHLEFFITSSSDDYLQVLLPGGGFDFCEHLTFTPIIIYNIKSKKFNFIKVIKEGDLYNEISNKLKEANFFQSNTDLKNIETSKNGFILSFKDNLASFKVSISEENNYFIAKYIE